VKWRRKIGGRYILPGPTGSAPVSSNAGYTIVQTQALDAEPLAVGNDISRARRHEAGVVTGPDVSWILALHLLLVAAHIHERDIVDINAPKGRDIDVTLGEVGDGRGEHGCGDGREGDSDLGQHDGCEGRRRVGSLKIFFGREIPVKSMIECSEDEDDSCHFSGVRGRIYTQSRHPWRTERVLKSIL